MIQRYSICLISIFNLYKLFPEFICTNNTGNLVNSLFGVQIFNTVPSFTSSSSPSSGGIGDMQSLFSLSFSVEPSDSFSSSKSLL